MLPSNKLLKVFADYHRILHHKRKMHLKLNHFQLKEQCRSWGFVLFCFPSVGYAHALENENVHAGDEQLAFL